MLSNYIGNTSVRVWQRLVQIDQAVMQVVDDLDPELRGRAYNNFKHDRYDCSDKGVAHWSKGFHIPVALRTLDRLQGLTGDPRIPCAKELLIEAMSYDPSAADELKAVLEQQALTRKAVAA